MERGSNSDVLKALFSEINSGWQVCNTKSELYECLWPLVQRAVSIFQGISPQTIKKVEQDRRNQPCAHH